MAEKDSISCAGAGRRGFAVMIERHGKEHMSRIGIDGGNRTREKYGLAHYAEIGAKGGKTTSKRHGAEFYARNGKKGGQRVKDLIARGRAIEKQGKSNES